MADPITLQMVLLSKIGTGASFLILVPDSSFFSDFRECSGRQSCGILVPNAELDKHKPCYKELKTYLQADFKCVKGNKRVITKSKKSV